MGLPLGVQTEGTHIAFAAGTGILPFIDLVAHLLLVLVSGNGTAVNSGAGPDLLEGSANKVNPDAFKLVLYTSFLDEDEAVGLELINALQELCQKLNKPIFEHHSRFSKARATAQASPRWDQAFFDAKIQEGVKTGAKKIWICGPPVA